MSDDSMEEWDEEAWGKSAEKFCKVAAGIRLLRRDADEDLNRLLQAKHSFFMQSPKRATKGPSADDDQPLCMTSALDDFDVYELISNEVNAIQPSYLAPAIHLNHFLEATALDIEWDVIKHSLGPDASRPSMGLRSVSIEVHWGAVMLSIKGALDRLVRVLRFYYPGFAAHTTWGRYDDKGKAHGFMAVVHSRKPNDQLLEYYDQAYTSWIKDSVAPRDALTHYQDPYSTWHVHPDGLALTSRQHIQDNSNKWHSSDPQTLCDRVQHWYDLADHTFSALAAMEPKAARKRAN